MRKFFTVYNGACAVIFLTMSAQAYIDPSVATYAIQAIAGVAVAVGAAAGILWHRVRKKAQEKLGIQLDAKKETEEDVVIFNETDSVPPAADN